MEKEMCKYYTFHGADYEGEYISCALEKNPEKMVDCKGNSDLCRNKVKLEEVTSELGTSES